MKKKTCKNKNKNIQKEFVKIEVLKSSTQYYSAYEATILNISEVDVEHQPDSPLQEMIILDPDDQPMWESAKIVAQTPNYVVISPDVDDNFVINSTHLKMIQKNKFDGYRRVDPHDHIREFLVICDMFKYDETQSEAVKLLISPLSLCDEAKTCLKEELQDMPNKYNELRDGNASKNRMNDDTPMCKRHEANYIQSEGYQNQDSHDPYSHQSLHDSNDSKKSLTKLNNDVKNDLEDFTGCIHSKRTVCNTPKSE
ncbi:hypothetical protein Tco_0790205 [Tanacetum coccineum]